MTKGGGVAYLHWRSLSDHQVSGRCVSTSLADDTINFDLKGPAAEKS